MQQSTQCTACRPGRPCLSHTRMPFGQAWIDSTHPKYRKRRQVIARDKAGRSLVSIKGWHLEDVPLAYIDWLVSEPVIEKRVYVNGKMTTVYDRITLYGEFGQRLKAYYAHPLTQARLKDMFGTSQPATEYKNLDTRWLKGGYNVTCNIELYEEDNKPLFLSDETAKVSCKIDAPRGDRWHGQALPKDDKDYTTEHAFQVRTDPTTGQETQATKKARERALDIVLDAIERLDACNDVHDFLEMKAPDTETNQESYLSLVARAAAMVTMVTARQALRDAYRNCLLRLQATRFPARYADGTPADPWLAERKLAELLATSYGIRT